MKKTFSIIALLLFLLQFVCGCKGNYISTASDSQSADNTKTMTITMLPSPPESKTTSDQNIIEKFIKIIDESEKQKREPDEINGWQIYVTVTDSNSRMSYTLRDNVLRIEDDFYTVDAEALTDEITDIFNGIKE